MSNFAFIESIITKQITKYYVTNEMERDRLSNQVFQHKYFSFDFKKVLMQNIIKEKLGKKDSELWKSIDELQRLRNIFAHGMFTTPREAFDDPQIDQIFLVHGGIEYKAAQLVKMYNEHSEIVTKRVMSNFGLKMEVYKNPSIINLLQ